MKIARSSPIMTPFFFFLTEQDTMRGMLSYYLCNIRTFSLLET